MTLKLLCTGLMCGDFREDLLRQLDTLSLQHARIDSVIKDYELLKIQQGTAKKLLLSSEGFYMKYDTLRQSVHKLVDYYKEYRDLWYKTPPGLMTALYMDFRMRHCTVQCFAFETAASHLIEKTSFGEIKRWHRWISGIPVCHVCQCESSEKRPLSLCEICENVFYCSLKCKKKNAKAHKSYCRSFA